MKKNNSIGGCGFGFGGYRRLAMAAHGSPDEGRGSGGG